MVFWCCKIVKWGLYYGLHKNHCNALGYCISLNFLIRQKTITCDTLSLWIPLYHCDDDKVDDDCNAANPAVISSRLHLRPKPLPPSPSPAIHSSHLIIISNIMAFSLTLILSRRHHHQLHHCPGYSSSHLSDTQTHSSLQGAAETTHLFATLSPFPPEI